MVQAPVEFVPSAVLERVSDGVAGFDREWRYTYANGRALTLLQRSAYEVLGRRIWELYPDAVGSLFYEAMQRAMAQQDVAFVESYYEPLQTWFECRIYPSPNGVTVFFHDATERKRTRDMLLGQARVLEMIAHGAPLARSLDALLRVIEAQCPGMQSSVLLLDADHGTLHHGAAPSLPEVFTRALDGGAIGPEAGSCGTAAFTSRPVITEDIASDPKWAGWREYALRLGLRACWSTPIYDDAERVLGTFAMYYRVPAVPTERDRDVVQLATHLAAIAITRDRTERERKEQERIRQQNLELEKANRVIREASRLKSQFLANMSHELRTPLNAIIGFSEYLLDGHGGPVNEQQQECLQHVLLGGKHLLRLVTDVLDLAKVEAGRLELSPDEFRVEDALREVCAVVGGLARVKNIALSVQCDPALDRVVLDPQKFKQVLFNLVANAVKFTQSGGSVDVSARALPERWLEVRVRDTGIGIDASDLPKLFVEFQQIENGKPQEGTGLGLALVKRLVESQHGRIGVESKRGVGSTFYFVLPCELRDRVSDAPSP